MKSQTHDELMKLLDAHDQRAAKAKQQKMEQLSAGDAFLKHFREVAHGVIKPVVDEMAEVLKVRGHQLSFRFQDEVKEHDGRTRDAQAEIMLIASGTKQPGSGNIGTDFTFLASRNLLGRVRLHQSTGNSAGSAGEFPMTQVTRELMEDELMKWLRKCL